MSDNDTKMTEPMSKEEMIDILKGLVFGTFDRTTAKEREALDMAIKVLAQTRWIPVSERLPEDSELVLFSTKTDRVFEGRYFADNTDRQWYAFRDECFAWNNVVTAWMPLPKPYESQEREGEE